MAIVQLLAFETTGLQPAKCRIIEFGFGTFDTKSGSLSASVHLFDPEDADLEAVAEVHGKSGLISALIDACNAEAFDEWPAPPETAHLRLTWSKAFITPHVDASLQRCKEGSAEWKKLASWLGVVQGSVEWNTFKHVAQALRGLDGGMPLQSRSEDKIRIMASLVKGML